MSSGRKVDRPIDLGLMEKTAQKLGFKTERQAKVMGYYIDRAMFENVDLVIHDKNSQYDVGFNGKEMLFDNYGGYVQNMMEQLMPEYQRTQFESQYLCVDKVLNMPDRIRLMVRR